MPFGLYTVDAYLPKYHIALEADGDYFHGCPIHTNDIYEITEQESRRAIRDERLWRPHGVVCLHLWGHSLRNDIDALNALIAVLSPWVE